MIVNNNTNFHIRVKQFNLDVIEGPTLTISFPSHCIEIEYEYYTDPIEWDYFYQLPVFEIWHTKETLKYDITLPWVTPK